MDGGGVLSFENDVNVKWCASFLGLVKRKGGFYTLKTI